MPKYETRIISSLAKVFPDAELNEPVKNQGSSLMNEAFSFQVAYRSDQLIKGIHIRVESELSEWISVRRVGVVPSELPVFADHDEHVLRSTPGLYPDPLHPISEEETLAALPGQWRAIWITVDPEGEVEAGTYTIRIHLENSKGETLGSEQFELELIPALLPEQKLLHTEWFHVDCLVTEYNVEVFSERHWQLIDRYVETAVKHGVNMLLTPLFTPPLDTQVGGERPTVQLLDVEVMEDQSYKFGFDRLERWVDLCQRNGIKYFEFSHLFTQWGAKHAPKIMATVHGEYKRIFGWETDAAGEAYHSFLKQLLPTLVAWINDHGLENNSYFHISDEPTIGNLESYEKASQIVRSLLPDFPIIDALSDYDFYSRGLVQIPVPANDHMEDFLQHEVTPLWTYYCCVQYKQVSNRFFSMPSARNRILGMQLYKYDVTGFLHWGYNFWYSQYATKILDPFQVTDADAAFPSGDSFLVYPGEEGPIESIRLEVLQEALQDLRALRLLEDIHGREYVLEALEEGLDEPITFSNYPREDAWLLSKREWINTQIKEHSSIQVGK
ncbi:DUF4091 domain-containing protein [Paenibacillus sp. GCM10028914]|uniref:DUF4091 domain-containing protein n=1 Tax=Paenibacillus sp. GCM10028914 TaxID=3273416 RepID=UPI00360B9E6A